MTKPILGSEVETGSDLAIDLKRLMVSRMLVDASSGGGKSWALRRVFEQTAGKVQQIMIDIEDEFATLREKFDYILCAPQGADAIATPQTATILARRLRETRVSAIISLYELKPPERRRFVRLFLEEFVEAPKSLWHPCIIGIDEAHQFCPEEGEAESLAAVNDLITRGRKRGLCGILATQRLSKLNKDSAAELHNKLIGLTVLDNDVKRAADDLGLTKKNATPVLRNLEPGEFFVFGPALVRAVTKIKVGPVLTTHPNAGTGAITKPPEPSERIKALLAKLADLPKEAEEEARTIEDFKRDNRELRRQLTLAKKGEEKPEDAQKRKRAIASLMQEHKRTTVLRQTLEEAMKLIIQINAQDFFGKADSDIDQAGIEKSIKGAVAEVGRLLEKRFESQRGDIERWRKEGDRLLKKIEKLLTDAEVPVNVTVNHNKPFTVAVNPAPPPRRPSPQEHGEGDTLPSPQQRILDAIAWFESIGIMEPLQTAVAFLAGYTYGGGGFNNPRGALRTAGLLEYRGDSLALTDAGRQRARVPDVVLSNEELHQRVLERLPGPERKLLTELIFIYPQEINDQDLAERTGYTAGGGGFNNPKGRLRSLGLVTYPGAKRVRAANLLFPVT